MKHLLRTGIMAMLCLCLCTALIGSTSAKVQAKEASPKELCKVALKVCGGAPHLKYQSAVAMDVGALSVSDRKKASSLMYLCDDKEAYGLCVIKAKSAKAAKALKGVWKKYQSSIIHGGYFDDYTAEEKKVIQGAVYGSKGKYVWYIALDSTKAGNQKGAAAICRKL